MSELTPKKKNNERSKMSIRDHRIFISINKSEENINSSSEIHNNVPLSSAVNGTIVTSTTHNNINITGKIGNKEKSEIQKIKRDQILRIRKVLKRITTNGLNSLLKQNYNYNLCSSQHYKYNSIINNYFLSNNDVNKYNKEPFAIKNQHINRFINCSSCGLEMNTMNESYVETDNHFYYHKDCLQKLLNYSIQIDKK